MSTQKIRNVQVIRCRRKTVGIRVTGEGKILVRAPLRMPAAEIRRIVETKRDWIDRALAEAETRAQAPKLTEEEVKALSRQAKKVIPPRAEAWARRAGVTYGRIAIRSQRTRWGSCSAKGNLNFNCLLMLCPEAVVDYVIVHELCHRKEMNHSRRFWAEVEKNLPEYREARQWLKTEGQAVIQRLA